MTQMLCAHEADFASVLETMTGILGWQRWRLVSKHLTRCSGQATLNTSQPSL